MSSLFALTQRARPHCVGGMPIFLKNLEVGRTVTLNVGPDDTVETLTMKIHWKEGLPPAMQLILYRGKHVDVGGTLRDHGIEADSTLHLLKLRPKQGCIYVKTLIGETFTVDIGADTTVKEVKCALETLTGEKFTVDIDADATVKDVKDALK
eukprot:gene32625-62161_t